MASYQKYIHTSEKHFIKKQVLQLPTYIY